MPTLSPHDVDRYLDRIDARLPDRPHAEALAELQLRHLRSVPFENLDIHAGRAIRLGLGDVFAKVVGRRRGGYCYELNSLFAHLLRSVGYDVDLVSARVARRDGTLGPEYDHLALVVRAVDDASPHVVDVGFGDAFDEPLPLIDGARRAQPGKSVGLTRHDDGTWEYGEDRGHGWVPAYRFATTPRRLADFAQMNRWQQTSPESHFTEQTVCSLLTPTGRVTLSGERLITTTAGERTERRLEPDETADVLRNTFGIEPPEQRVPGTQRSGGQ